MVRTHQLYSVSKGTGNDIILSTHLGELEGSQEQIHWLAEVPQQLEGLPLFEHHGQSIAQA